MNTKTLLQLALLGFGLNASDAAAKEYAIAISPNVSVTQAKLHYSKAVSFLVNMQAGDNAFVIDGDSLATLGRFTIPKNPIYASIKARVSYNKSTVGNMAKFAKAAKASSTRIAGAVRLPQLLRHIAANRTAPEIDVIVLGSALYDAPATPAFTMKDGVFPSDGHLKHGRDITPFGVTHPAQLSGLRIHLGFYDAGLSDRKLHFIERFWTLYAQAQGAQLVTFTKDLPTLYNRLKNNVEPPQNNYKQGDSNKLQMIRLAPQKLQSQSIYNRPVSTSALKAKQLQKAKNVQVGIAWQCQRCDLDLYAKARPDAQVLWFGHTKSPLGIYFKDYQKSPDAKNGYETIAYTTPIDLRALQIFVNFYKGNAPKGVRGEVRISVDGKTYSKPFHIKAKRGGSAAAVLSSIKSGQVTGNAMIAINPLDVVTR